MVAKPEMSPPEYLSTRLHNLWVDKLLLEMSRPFFFDRCLKVKPWPWYKRWAYRYWTRPWRGVRHSLCCGEEHDGG